MLCRQDILRLKKHFEHGKKSHNFQVGIVMTLINKYNPYEFRKASRDMRIGAKRSEHLGFLNSLWFNFAALVEQSSRFLPRWDSRQGILYVFLFMQSFLSNDLQK